jgi:hypothetical protein
MPPDQKVSANAVTKARFGRDVAKREFESALIYKLQRKKRIESDDQSKADSTSSEDTSTSLQLLVIWGSNGWHSFSVRALLIKHSITITWNEDRLENLYSMYVALLNKGLLIDVSKAFYGHYSIEDTWFFDGSTVLMTTSKWKRDSYTFEIAISEGTREDGSMDPLWVSSNM